MRFGLFIVAMLAVVLPTEAQALDLTDDLTITGYADARIVAPTDQPSWLKGGLGKFRYGSGQQFGGEAVLQATWQVNSDLTEIGRASCRERV